MSLSNAQKLFLAVDAIDDYARDYLFAAKRAFDASEISEAEWKGAHAHHRKLVVAAAGVEDLAHDALGDALKPALADLEAATKALKKTEATLTKAKVVVKSLTAFIGLAGTLAGLSSAPSPATVAAVANAALLLAKTVRDIDDED